MSKPVETVKDAPMMIKVAEATGPALDWMVAKCEGRTYLYFTTHGGDYNGWTTGPHYLQYSTDWSQGGPIIEREKLNIEHFVSIQFPAPTGGWCSNAVWESPTPLIAAMRCFVASKLGDEVEVPEELL